jgi:hypothetical protein
MHVQVIRLFTCEKKEIKLKFSRGIAYVQLHAMTRTGLSKMEPNVDTLTEEVQFCIGYGKDI